jgi:hypothetical protein
MAEVENKKMHKVKTNPGFCWLWLETSDGLVKTMMMLQVL